MELQVYNVNGQPSGATVKLNEAVFGVEPNDHAIYMDVKLILANRHQGTHKTKDRSEVTGSTRKLYRQKGTGNARRGDVKSPILRHGGTIFGPRPRSYGFKLNKKVKRLARRSALAYKFRDNNITIVENLNFDTPKTKQMLEVLAKLQLTGKKFLLVTAFDDTNLLKSTTNIEKLRVEHASRLNTYDILNADRLLLVRDSVELVNNLP